MYKNEDFFQIIGHISIFFATLDFFVSVLLTDIVKETCTETPKLNDTLGKKLRFLKSLAEKDVNNIVCLMELKKNIDEAIEISDERNRYIHDQWIFDEKKIKQGYIRRIKIIGTRHIKIVEEQESLSLNDLQVFLKKIGNMQKKISSLCKNFH